jgi:hypothetical protein
MPPNQISVPQGRTIGTAVERTSPVAAALDFKHPAASTLFADAP